MNISRIDEDGDDLDAAKGELEASGVVGVWDWNPVTDMCRLDRGAARLLAGNESLAGQEIHRAVATAAVHPDDVGWLRDETTRLARRGGIYIAEYRVVQPSGHRWLLSRGTISLDSSGRASSGKGILIDLTDSREPGRGYVSIGGATRKPLQDAVTHAIMALEAVRRDGNDTLRMLSETLVLELGHELTRRIRRSGLNP